MTFSHLGYRYPQSLQCVYILDYSIIPKFKETPIKTILGVKLDDFFNFVFWWFLCLVTIIMPFFYFKLSKVCIFCPVITLNIPLITFTAFFDSSLGINIYTKTVFAFSWWIFDAKFLHDYLSIFFLIILLAWFVWKVINLQLF